ncbi:hypothetical protein CKO50_13080 [Pseudoalteromonas sp. HM-SA03]|uniref:hypothetical protein n=1 Tax=Pseudoalteromonas sp. HM-SA03 TaxID=2029678 RepID=UPI000BAE4B3D|nr:hypothetical protein [Pseudoalteromonas sp. HM-SA03]PAY00910.1 hypothetical protein CKO50_13080 [Pseudoalteromonas sp. HM-SA03]
MELNKISNKALKLALKASAVLDIEISDDAYLRCFTYTENWVFGIDIATYDNGGGDNIAVVIKDESILIKGFDHESEVSPHAQEEYGVWPGMYNGAPTELVEVLNDEVFEIEEVTFCIWRLDSEAIWSREAVELNNVKDDGSSWLLSAITTTPSAFIEYVESYYDGDFNQLTPEKVHDVFAAQM